MKKIEWYEDFHKKYLEWMVKEIFCDQIWDFGHKVRKYLTNENKQSMIPIFFYISYEIYRK